jgi:hypothetical protein
MLFGVNSCSHLIPVDTFAAVETLKGAELGWVYSEAHRSGSWKRGLELFEVSRLIKCRLLEKAAP